MTEYFGGIEAGGTKFICAIGQGQGDIKEEKVIPTKTPEETLPEVCDFFKPYKLSGITLGSFGPFDKREGSPTYGHILQTNKTEWINCPIVETLSQNLKTPIYLETDVTTSAIGEYYWGAGKGCNNFIYLTVGTGIGGCLMVNGAPLPCFNHSEMGHISISGEKSPGACNFHDHCLEGYASGQALQKRWKINSLKEIDDNHPLWEETATFLAKGILNLVYMFSPQKVILGGGVMKREFLFPQIIDKVLSSNGSYTVLPKNMVVKPGLNDQSGVIGAMKWASLKKTQDGIK